MENLDLRVRRDRAGRSLGAGAVSEKVKPTDEQMAKAGNMLANMMGGGAIGKAMQMAIKNGLDIEIRFVRREASE